PERANKMALYSEDFPIGTLVRITERPALEQFMKSWKYHHPLEPFQLEFAGIEAEVADVGFYHGGDVLYVLKDVPGIWHEQCLERID
ncbi:MAG: hypothetical protein ACJ72Z_10990, partial [Pyrinomonadaceae bacterium]